jgi:calcium channel MID1
VTGDIYVGIQAPNITNDFEDVYNFEVAASIDDYYHKYDESKAELLWMDSDASSVLLMTKSLTQDKTQVASVMKQPLPYELFIQDDSTPRLKGIQRSVCGLTEFAAIVSNREGNGQQNKLVRSSLTANGPGRMPAQQFYLEGLKASSSYTGILVKLADDVPLSARQDGPGESGPSRGRGTVFEATTFQTLNEGANCQLVSNLEFCDEVPYTAPGNKEKFSNTELGKKYDDYAREMYQNFEKVMMQIPCETEAVSQYSLARNCNDCREAYKRWLCSVIIPRCDMLNSTNQFAIPRNVGQAFPDGSSLSKEEREKWDWVPGFNASRNAFIDKEVEPGPYKEILPCEEVCYEVVQSCPAEIGFNCPQPGMAAFEQSYGQRRDDGSVMSCNYPGEPRTRVGAAGSVRPPMCLLVAVGLFGPLLFLF